MSDPSNALFAVLAATIAGLSSIVAAVVQRIVIKRLNNERRLPEAGPREKLEALIANLNEANNVIRDIEAEVRARQAAAEKLQHDASDAQQLLELNKGQLDAVRSLIGSELKHESRRGFWLGAAVNFLFFVSGAGLTLIFG